MDRPSCGTCKHFKDVGYQRRGECTAHAPCWAWGEYIETTRQVFRDGSTEDLAPDCEAYKPATKSCTWTEDADGNWHTGCQEIQVFFVGTPDENSYVYCPYCGGKIENEGGK